MKVGIYAKSQQLARHAGSGKLHMPPKHAERVDVNKSTRPRVGPEQGPRWGEQDCPPPLPVLGQGACDSNAVR